MRRFFYAPKNLCLMGKMKIIFGGYTFLCLPPYNLNFRYFEIKPLVRRTSNYRELTVYARREVFGETAWSDLSLHF